MPAYVCEANPRRAGVSVSRRPAIAPNPEQLTVISAHNDNGALCRAVCLTGGEGEKAREPFMYGGRGIEEDSKRPEEESEGDVHHRPHASLQRVYAVRTGGVKMKDR